MYDGPTPSKLGRFQTSPSMQLDRLHAYDGAPLREVEHAIPVPVLDQEDLGKQGVDTSRLVKGAKRVDALGSCTCNAGTTHLAERLNAAGKDLATATLPSAEGTLALSGTDSRVDEEFAIVLYHLVTDQTGNPSTEWPPTDSGSSGYYVCTELERRKLIASYKSASGIMGALSLLQAGTVMQGTPWLNAWFTPDSQGFIDGDGSLDALQDAIASGVAGGHETTQRAIVQLGQLRGGGIDLQNTYIKVRNSWSASWNGAFAGDFLMHASTLNYIAHYCDFKQAVI